MSESTEIEPFFVTKSVAEVVDCMSVLTSGKSRFFDEAIEAHLDLWIERRCLVLSLIGSATNKEGRKTVARLGYAIYRYCGGEICVRCLSAKGDTVEQIAQTVGDMLSKLIGEGRPFLHMNINANDLPMLNLLKGHGLKACGTTKRDDTEFYYMTNNPDEVFRTHD